MVGYSNEVDKQKIANIFNNFDKRKKGELDYDEIRMFLLEVFEELEEDISQLNEDSIIRELLELFDHDQNGLINFMEFIKLVEFLILEKGLKIY